MIDREDHLTFVNPYLAKRLGYRVEELIGRPVADVIEPENGMNRPGVKGQYRKFKCQDGGEFQAALATSPLYDHEERYSGVLGIVM